MERRQGSFGMHMGRNLNATVRCERPVLAAGSARSKVAYDRVRVRCSEKVAPIPAINGPGDQSCRDGGARCPAATVDSWYRNRARTGHPEKASWIGWDDHVIT